MQLHEVKSEHPGRKSKRVGRGGKRGTTSGHGQKGQKSRAGKSIKPNVREMLLRFPKLRGINFKSTKAKVYPISLDMLGKVVENKEVVTLQWLLKKRLAKKSGGKSPSVKILDGKVEFTKVITVKGVSVSESAKKRILDQGGTIE
ncbi:MAG: uL15 family ribosomal protein [Parcubacteria group bacterium]|nr:uL15 family ribosomal protein [Parcubacteria group bacterium]